MIRLECDWCEQRAPRSLNVKYARYLEDEIVSVTCPACSSTGDWEVEIVDGYDITEADDEDDDDIYT